jgi:cell division protein FtsI/penicillin-binding protein 2
MKHTNFSHLMICVFMCCISQPMVVISQNYTITIDDSIQPIVEAEMKSRLQTTEAEWACAILMDKNNQVVALYDTDSLGRNAYQPIEIGSIIEPFSVMAALRTGRVSEHNQFPLSKAGYRDHAGYMWHDHHPIDTVLDVPSVIAVSSRSGICQIMEKAFADNPMLFAQYMNELGLSLDIDSLEDVLRMANGLGVNMSPIYLTYLYSQLVQKQFPEEVWGSTQPILHALHEVVWNNIGTASKAMWTKGAQSEIVSIIGKTGNLKEAGERQPHTISFIGAFPEQNPEYTLLVLLKKVPYPSSAKIQCAEPMRYIAERIWIIL